MIKLGLIMVVPGGGWLVSAAADSPVEVFQQLGIAGVVAVVVWLWQRDTAKQRDRLMDSQEKILPVLMEVQHALQRSNETHQLGTEAAKAMTDALRDLPTPEIRWRMIRALEDAEERLRRGE